MLTLSKRASLQEAAIGRDAICTLQRRDQLHGLITLYYVVITAKLRRNGLNCNVGEADSSTAVQHDPGIS